MTIINVNSISGINSITAQGASGIEFYDSSGNLSGDITLGVGATISGSTNVITFDTGVTTPIQVDSNGLTVGTGATIGGSTNTITASTNGYESLRIDSSGRLLVGTSSNGGSYVGIEPVLQVEGTSYDTSTLSVYRNGNVSADDSGILLLGRSRGAAIGDNNAVISGDRLGTLEFIAADGTNRGQSAAAINCRVDSTPSTGSVSGRLTFLTTSDGDSLATERLIITNNGTLRLLNSPGIDFSQIQTDAGGTVSEILNHYEEGVWTPTLYGNAVAGTYSPVTANGGIYTRIGNIVHAQLNVQGTITGAGGQPRISGLPYAAVNPPTGGGNSNYSTGSLQYWDGGGADWMGPLIIQGTAVIYFHNYDGDSSGNANITNGAHNLHCSVTYRCA